MAGKMPTARQQTEKGRNLWYSFLHVDRDRDTDTDTDIYIYVYNFDNLYK